MAAAQFNGKIVVFGGVSRMTFNSYILNEEGELEDDLSEDPFIPGSMCLGSFTVQEGRILAVGRSRI